MSSDDDAVFWRFPLESMVKSEETSLFDGLPNEIVVHIFSFVKFVPKQGDWGKIKRVCKMWEKLANVAFDPSACNNYAIRHVSCKGDWKTLASLLQDKRIDPSANNNYCLRWSCRNGFVEAVKLLLKDARVDPNDKENYAINWAVSQGHADVVEELLHHVHPNTIREASIVAACTYGHTKVLLHICKDARFDASIGDQHLIRWCCRVGHTDHVRELLRNPTVDPQTDFNYPIRVASQNGYAEIVKLLMSDWRVNPSDCSDFAVRMASFYNHKNVVTELLKDPRVNLPLFESRATGNTSNQSN